jgi:hypothetical protein
MIGEQTFEGRRESLAQANKLSRTYATLLEALNRHRGKGQQKVTVAVPECSDAEWPLPDARRPIEGRSEG